MNYKDLILESYLEDQDELDTYDSYDENDTSEYEDAYLEGYMYALAEANGMGGDAADAVFARITKGQAPAVSSKTDEEEKVNKTADVPTRREPETEAQRDARMSQNQKQIEAEKGAIDGAKDAATGKKPKITGKQAAFGAGAVAAGAGAVAAAVRIKNKKKYNVYKAAGGKLSFKEWIKAGKPAPKAPKKAISAVKKVMKEAYEQAYLEAYYGTLEELGKLD